MNQLDQYRHQINQLDAQIIPLLEQRFATADAIANYKAVHDQPIYDPQREEAVYTRLKEVATHQDLLPYLSTIYQTIMQTTKNREQQKQEDLNHD
ncbi:chorismate mutase [Fructilactobacillus hinvesii]|uniref:Chorismate mutase n=1 Tax=Fructilactobacillus hinvesii TaxID=2940300 RepID=A0ABY5BVH8_9LACO|nr:chorismate mutase [Fructilactobacillus hinvesii]USS88276.1 chorismate mutase [Fructilactobacillus hinvesii]